jgi:hypothetical protein
LKLLYAAVKSRNFFVRHFWLSYPMWLAVCAFLFVAFRDAPDPARRTDRVDNDDAEVMALAILKKSDPLRYADYEVVHTAGAKRGEAEPGAEPRWLVLCDRRERTGLSEAVVVHLRARDGAFLEIRPVDRSSAAMGAPIVRSSQAGSQQ